MILYAIQSGEFIKIGITENLRRRLHDMRLMNPHPIKVVARREINRSGAKEIEICVHRVLASRRFDREWFKVDPALARRAIDASIRAIAEHHLKKVTLPPRPARIERPARPWRKGQMEIKARANGPHRDPWTEVAAGAIAVQKTDQTNLEP